MKAEDLAEWIKTANVIRYQRESDYVAYVATKGNEQLFLTCRWINYSDSVNRVPQIAIIWAETDKSTLLYRDVVDDVFGQIKHSVGELEGEWGIRENVETVFAALYHKVL